MPHFTDEEGREWAYDEERPLGEGGFGFVFRGSCVDTGEAVAVKRVPMRDPGEAAEKQRRRETEIAERLTSARSSGADTSHLVVPIGWVFRGTDLLLVLPLADGSLGADLRDGPLELAAGLDAVAQTARGLVQLAALSIVHRDLKPGNVLRYGTAWRITDFGISRILTEATATHTLARKGTFPYLAPELWQSLAATAKSDLYALGVLAYEVFAGRVPFPGPQEHEFRNQHLGAAPPEIPGLPPRLSRLILRLLSKSPAERPQDARAVLTAIGDLSVRLDAQREALVDAALARQYRTLEDHESRAARAEAGERTTGLHRQALADLAAILQDAYDDIREALPDATLDDLLLTAGGIGIHFRTLAPFQLSDRHTSPTVLLAQVHGYPAGAPIAASAAGRTSYASLAFRRTPGGGHRWEVDPQLLTPGSPAAVPLDVPAVIRILRDALAAMR